MFYRNNLKTRMVLVVSFILITTAAGYPQSVVVPTERFADVKKQLKAAVNKGDIPSVSIAVSKDGEIIWEESFGWANREKMIPATPHTVYSMASISKPMAVTGLMVLQERGKVDLNKPVNDYISPLSLNAFEGESDDASIKHIINHTSGLPVHYTCFYIDEPDNQPPTKTESIRRYGIIVHPPGSTYQYSNFGYSLLDHIIFKVSGQSYTDFMKKEVFLPLGMMRTSIDIGKGMEEYAAERYYSDGSPVPFYISDHPGASQVYSSVHDVIRFGVFHLNYLLEGQYKILTDETLDLMKADSDPDTENNRYGLGWFLREDEFGYPVVWHTGSMAGVNNILKMVPSENIVVAALFNTNTGLRNTIANDIIGELLPDYGEKLQEQRSKERPKPEPWKAVPELTGEWEGELVTYDNRTPVKFVFQEDGDIHVDIKDQFKTLLNSPRYLNKVLTGRFDGTIPSSDGLLHDHFINIKLIFDGTGKLSGYASTSSTTERFYGTFSSYLYLNKK